jgi:prepilin-type processing-associated H-X9-DG protein/prepilin-type N-terminal cleavage/methylation domain-containing protein
MNSRLRHRASGFTLTELLIVIAIIAVLVSIMFPLFGGMREKARATACAQNLRQIGVGLLSYVSENNGRFPDGSADVSWKPGIATSRCWYDAAAENMGREYVPFHKGDPLPDAFGCPSGHGKAHEPKWPYTGDYAANLYLGHPDHNVRVISAVKRPESTPYVQDTVNQNNFTISVYGSGISKTANAAFAARHGGRGNILWVDGHVSAMGYSEYMQFANKPSRGGAYNFIRGNW